MKIFTAVAELLRADRQTGRQTWWS